MDEVFDSFWRRLNIVQSFRHIPVSTGWWLIFLVPTMPGPKNTDSGKRGYDGDDSDKPSKKQKKLTKHEQLEEGLQQKATILGKALDDLKTTLTSYTLEDKEANDFIRVLLTFCDEVKCGEHQRNAAQAELLEFPLQLLEENDLAKLNPREHQSYYVPPPAKPFACRAESCIPDQCR
jgi:hypothetical protein